MADSNPLKERRIKDAVAAKTLYKRLRTNSESRRAEQARVLTQLNGGKPFSDADLVKLGQGWRANVNFRDAASMFEQVMVAYWRLFHDSPNLAAVTVHGDSGQEQRWADLFQEAYNRFIEDWGADYVFNYLMFASQHVGHGVGLAAWDDTEDPRWEAVKLKDVEVPEKTSANVNKIPLVAVRREISLEDLYRKVRDESAKSASDAAGWNVAAVTKVLGKLVAQKEGKTFDENNPVEVLEMIRGNALAISCEYAPIPIVHILVKEYDGKISRQIIAPDVEIDEFLFDDYEISSRPETLTEALAIVFFEVGDGNFWGIKGFAAKNYQLATILNRLKSRAVDRTILDGLNFRDLSDGSREVVPITNIGPVNILPKDLEQIPQYPSGQVSLETIGIIEQQSAYNNARYRDQSRQIGNTQTATQATILANLQSQVDVANATLYLTQIARSLLTEQFRRLRKKGSDNPDAKKFRERCIERGGMPKEVFYDAEITLRTGSDPGAASAALQAQFSSELLSLGADPNVNRRWAFERWVSTRFGAQAVKHALNPVNALGDVAAQRQALMENSDMGEGNPLPVAQSDNHREHIPVHLQPLQMLLDAYKSSGRIDPNALIALQSVIPHVEQHFAMVEGDKTYDDVRKQFGPLLSAITSQAEGLFKQVERLQQEAQQGGAPSQGGMDPAGMVGAVAQQ